MRNKKVCMCVTKKVYVCNKKGCVCNKIRVCVCNQKGVYVTPKVCVTQKGCVCDYEKGVCV